MISSADYARFRVSMKIKSDLHQHLSQFPSRIRAGVLVELATRALFSTPQQTSGRLHSEIEPLPVGLTRTNVKSSDNQQTPQKTDSSHPSLLDNFGPDAWLP